MSLALILLPFLILQGQDSWLARYDVLDRDAKQFNLPRRLGEASGLATTPDGRLFSHDDELGVIYQLDPASGKIRKHFTLGTVTLRGDLEGLAIKGEMFYLATSSGNIYEFKEGANNARVPYRMYRTPLSIRNDIEGLEYDDRTDCLLLVCKGEPALGRRKRSSSGRTFRGHRAVYAFSLSSKTLMEEPRFLIPMDQIVKKSRKGEFMPSGIAQHPRTKTFFIISAQAGSVIELSSDGKLLAQEELPHKVNSQPEGIAFLPNLSMTICNDGQGGTGTLTVYPLKP